MARKGTPPGAKRGPYYKPKNAPPPPVIGRPEHVPTDRDRNYVRIMHSGGKTQAQICEVIGISPNTLAKHYPDELRTAKHTADAAVIMTLHNLATGGPGPDAWKKANVSAAIFWAKTRMGWKEPKNELVHSGAVGTFDLTRVTDDELATLKTILTAADPTGGNSGGGGEEGDGEASP